MNQNHSKVAKDLVECWDDEERMDFLFSDFPADVSVNPEHWKSKIEFWVKLITDLSSSSTSACVNFNTVKLWVERKGRSPLGLQVVWDHMINNKLLVPASEYIGDIARNASWVGWGMNMLVRKPTMWVAGKMLSPLKNLSPIKSSGDKAISYVCKKSLSIKCLSLLEKMRSMRSHIPGNLHIISLSGLLTSSADIVTSEKDLEFLLLTLERDKKVIVFKNENNTVAHHCISEKYVKFVKLYSDIVDPVSEYDLGIIKLEEARKELEKQISVLYQDRNKLVQTARECLRKGERVSAKSALRQKQRSEASVKNKETALDNIQQLLDKIEQCKTDQMIMEAYRAGVATYNKTVRENGLNIETVESTMDDVNSLLENHEEISATLATSLADESVSNEELEKELSMLLCEENGILSSQTDADIAKLVSGMSAVSTRSPAKSNTTRQVSPRKNSGQLLSL